MCPISIDEAMMKEVHRKAVWLKKNSALAELDTEDIESEMYLELLDRMGEYQPERSPIMAFVHMVLTGKGAKLIRKYTGRAETMRREAQQSLDEVAGHDEDGLTVTLGDMQENPAARAELADRDGRLDQEAMARTLPERLLPVFRMLVHEGLTQTEAAARLGLPLTTFRDQFFYPLRKELSKRGYPFPAGRG